MNSKTNASNDANRQRSWLPVTLFTIFHLDPRHICKTLLLLGSSLCECVRAVPARNILFLLKKQEREKKRESVGQNRFVAYRQRGGGAHKGG